MDKIGESQVVVTTLEIQDEALLKEVIEYRKSVPIILAKVDSLEEVIEDGKKEIIEIHTIYKQQIQIIKENDVCEDMEFFNEYLGIRDTLPKLAKIEGKKVVIISKEQLKKSNLTFVSHDAYTQERVVLLENAENYELAIDELQAANDTLSVVVIKQDVRIELNKDIIVEKDKQIGFFKKRGTKRTIGAIFVGIVIGGTAVLILK
ncbi:MAG: hypothetical protein ACTSQF_00190 [Candidatus Heimdallarchaeaceae archaeon]